VVERADRGWHPEALRTRVEPVGVEAVRGRESAPGLVEGLTLGREGLLEARMDSGLRCRLAAHTSV
jgi:hypothetical protein